MKRCRTLRWLLITGCLMQLGCSQKKTESGVLQLCATDGADAFIAPHVVINQADKTLRAFDFGYALVDCSNERFVCLDGPIPFIRPIGEISATNSNIEILGNSEVSIVALPNGKFKFEIARTESSSERKITYTYKADGTFQNLEISDDLGDGMEVTRFETCG